MLSYEAQRRENQKEVNEYFIFSPFYTLCVIPDGRGAPNVNTDSGMAISANIFVL